MAGDSAAKREWIERVLNLRLPGAGEASLAEARQRWQQAQSKVKSELEAFRTALLADAEIKADPRFPFVRAAAAELPRMLPASGRQIDALLTSGSAQDAIAAVGQYRQELDAARHLERLEDFATRSLRIKLTLRATLSAAAQEIEATLRAAA